MTETPRERNRALAFAGAGFSFAAIVLVMAYAGHLLDGVLGTEPWMVVVGSMIGVAAATWELIRAVSALEKKRPGAGPPG